MSLVKTIPIGIASTAISRTLIGLSWPISFSIGVASFIASSIITRKVTSNTYIKCGTTNVLVHSTTNPVNVIIYFHGKGASISEVLNKLSNEFDKTDSIIIVPQLPPSSALPSDLSGSGGILKLLACVRNSIPSLHDINPDYVVLMAHSGGYLSTAASLDRGGVGVSSVVLLDALYGNVDIFERFARGPHNKFINIYGPSTADNSISLASRLQNLSGSDFDNSGNVLVNDNSSMITARTKVNHEDVPLNFIAWSSNITK